MLGPGDDSTLAQVADDVFDAALDARSTQEFLADPRHRLCVALDAGVVVGFASAVIYVHPDKPKPELWINEVGVAPSHWRRGIGRAVMDAILADARRAGCSEAWVLTDRTNEAAQRLYAASGGEASPDAQVMFTFPLSDRG
jgi:ribosomal protein S18 acetylase RimI-like enzyme